MDKEIEAKYERELSNSSPITYKNIVLYPVLYKDYRDYCAFVQCLLYDNIHYPDDRLSLMPRLYFLTDLVLHTSDKEYLELHVDLRMMLLQLQGLLSLVLKDQRYAFQIYGNNVILRVYTNGEEEYTDIKYKQFEVIRKIILAQNNTTYDDTFIHKDVMDWIKQQEEFEREHGKGGKIPTLEDKKEALMLEFKTSDEHFADEMSIRRFNRLVDKLTSREIYNAQITGSMSGMVKFKEEPINWIYTQPPRTVLEKYFKAVKL